MIAYSIGFLPLIRDLQDTHPNVTELWYVDDAGVVGEFGSIMEQFRDMQVSGPPRGYFLERNKSVLVIPAWASGQSEILLYFICSGSRVQDRGFEILKNFRKGRLYV